MRLIRLFPAILVFAVPVAALADTAAPTPAPMTSTQVKAAQAQNAQATTANRLIDQAQKAQQAHDWAGAEAALKQLVAMDAKRWDYAQHLGDAQYNEGKYKDAVQTYNTGIALAQADTTDPAGAKQAMGAMYTNQGAAYLKLKRSKDAAAAYEKAAVLSDNPGIAYFNLCVLLYNAKEDDGAVEACDKAIAADPTRPDAYYIKGSVLVGEGETNNNGKFVVPKGTVEALKTYLKLSPHGAHAGDVQQMLDLINSP
ncbi:MAG TPA: tetratricopeptide repeat protein [Gammaproteobacteria bacterium]|nr:tetratricopeptide repeat protein [Gammaproteobacteria bacterium]